MAKGGNTGKCVNFGGCSKADAREMVDLAVGQDSTCPECGKALSVVGKSGRGGGGGGGKKPPILLFAGAGVVLLGVMAAFLMWPSSENPEPDPNPAPIPAPAPDPQPQPEPPGPQPQPNPEPQPQPGPDPTPIPQVPVPNPEPQPQPQPQSPPLDPTPRPKPGPRSQPVNPDPNPNPQPTSAPYTGPTSGTLVWEGTISGTELVTIQDGSASPGMLLSGKLPGVPVLIQPLDEKRVSIAAAPQPGDQYQRLVFRVKNKGKTRITVRWALP